MFPSQNESVSGRESFLSKGSVSVEKLQEPKFSGQGTFPQAHINFSRLRWLSEARVPEFHPRRPSLCIPEALAGGRVPCLVAVDSQVLVIVTVVLN